MCWIIFKFITTKFSITAQGGIDYSTQLLSTVVCEVVSTSGTARVDIDCSTMTASSIVYVAVISTIDTLRVDIDCSTKVSTDVCV